MSKTLLVSLIAGSVMSLSAFAQSGNSQLIGRFVMADLRGSVTDEDIELKLDDDEGYGLAWVNHFTPSLSLELAAARVEPELIATADDLPFAVPLGEVQIAPLTAAIRYHFIPSSRISPYVGAGVAYVLYDELSTDVELGDGVVDFDNSFGYLANAGIDVRITEFVGINFDAKYLKSKSEASADGEPLTLEFEVDPLVTSIGLSLTF